jgi:hypothetical protein
MPDQEHVGLAGNHERRGDDGWSPPLAGDKVDFHLRSGRGRASCPIALDTDEQISSRNGLSKRLAWVLVEGAIAWF